jgi:broad specificity phosphatase PhoE
LKFFLIRHGKSVANSNGFVTGSKNDPLSEVGVAQAEAMRGFVDKIGIDPDIFIVSDWLRAQQTAKIVWPAVKWVVDERVGETNAGVAANLPLNKFLEEYPNFYNSPTNAYPYGESHEDLKVRAISWLEEIMKKDFESVALVAHSGPISCLIQYVLNISMNFFPAAVPAHASLSIIEIKKITASKFDARLIGFSILSEARMSEITSNVG